MTENIFQIINENDIDEIIDDNPFRHIVIGIATKHLNKLIKLKHILSQLAKNNPNTICLYVDLIKFNYTTHKYTSNINGFGRVLFYFNKSELGKITDIEDDQSIIINSTFTNLNTQIKDVFHSNNTDDAEVEISSNIKKNKYSEINKVRQLHEIMQLEKIKKLKELEESL
jgi:hypothetical protein